MYGHETTAGGTGALAVLASTGGDLSLWASAGVVAIAFGVFLVGAARRTLGTGQQQP